MKRFIASLLLSTALFSGQAQAWVGGPYDNGLHGGQLENSSIYQTILRFKNGSGYCYFSPDQQLASEVPSLTDLTDQRGSTRNKTVLYYKGIIYVGSAFGTVDAEAKLVQGQLNATSEASTTSNTTTTNANFFTFTNSTAQFSNTISASNRSFTLNGNYDAKIYRTTPSMRYRGEGEIAILSPGGSDSVAGLAYEGYSQLISAINNSVSNTTATSIFSGVNFSEARDAIDAALQALPTYLVNSGINQTYDAATTFKIKVTGTRRYVNR
jgi:hypothetical protein